jgi:hypothetical protein
MLQLHVLKVKTPRGVIQVVVNDQSSFEDFLDSALEPYNSLRAMQEPFEDDLIEIHYGMAEDWEIIDWHGIVPTKRRIWALYLKQPE